MYICALKIGPSELAVIVVVDLLCVPQVRVHRLLSKYPFQVSENSYKNIHYGTEYCEESQFITCSTWSPNENKINILSGVPRSSSFLMKFLAVTAKGQMG